MDDIEERLRSHAQAFNGLLSLIPAKYYYGDESATTDQWQRKKQTKEQAREAKRAKLDPESAKTAKDVMDENARKRKRGGDEEEEAGSEHGSDDSSAEDLGSEIPKEGLNRGDAKSKKQKQQETAAGAGDKISKPDGDAESRRKLKEEKKAQKKAAQKEKKKAKDASKKEKNQEENPAADAESQNGPAPTTAKTVAVDDEDEDDEMAAPEGLTLEFNPEQPSTASSAPNSPSFDTSNPHSGSSSISSIVPPTDSSKTPSSSEPKPLKSTPEELKQRLQKRLDELRARRHADGLNGKPARNRQELIEARRQKAEQRRNHKKELRQKAREEEEKQKDEAMARRFSPGGSGSLLASPRSPADSIGSNSNNFGFGRVVFADGQHTDAALQSIRDKPKSQGAQDPASALKAAEAKKARFAAMSDEQRTDIEEKDMWLNAKKRAHGERVRDDTSLLKKALKRKESAKKKSTREWGERMDGIAKGRDMRQSKREENLRKRREEKGSKGKKGPGGSGGGGGGKKKSRPGFEGSFKAKVGGGGGKKK